MNFEEFKNKILDYCDVEDWLSEPSKKYHNKIKINDLDIEINDSDSFHCKKTGRVDISLTINVSFKSEALLHEYELKLKKKRLIEEYEQKLQKEMGI